ncbi:DNA methyltransferase [Variovorax guangxiensis]|uniref:DNA methylase n=1 Tax=Variovorax guangxiensis TaxID=1775474 RepID=A0A502DFL0_9BURK|nr:DNA methyltransferase [Variovorax guangxiensis]TPG23470.1 DNA methylase [Variovorax guangxiensis]TPG24071.1 DNA methylase [Variovorax ginsengisoli]
MNLDREAAGERFENLPEADTTKKKGTVASIAKLYRTPLPSTRTGPLYNAFSYPTKISPEAIAVYIAAHTEPGATVVDAFGGSGTTGVAALLCDRPTPEMRRMADTLGIKPKWGARSAHLIEIGTLGAFVSDTLCHPPEPEVFADAVDELCRQAESKLGWLYEAKDAMGRTGTLRHAIWSDVLACPHCKTEVSLWDASVKTRPLGMADSYRCKGCRKQVAVEACDRVTEATLDAFGRKQLTKKRALARVHGRCGSTKWQRPPTDEDRELLTRIAEAKLPKSAPNADIEWGELRRAGYHVGIDKLHHFYTKRNFIAMATLMELASAFPTEVRDPLRLLVLSYNASHSTLMTRVVLKKGQSDFVLTGAQSGVLYISGLPVEKNILEGVRRKSKAFIDSFRLLHGSRSKVVVHNASSEAMPIKARSVDYIFTDPPFGAYIPYAELNQINELWLGRTTDRAREVIISPSQLKGVAEYGAMMGAVFKDMARVLKPGGLATVVFHSAHSEVWRALAQAYSNAGFAVEATSVLDKIQASFKQVVSAVSVKGDPLLLLSKRAVVRGKDKPSLKIAAEVIRAARNGSRGDPQRLYSQFVGKCLELGREVDIDAKTFYAMARADGPQGFASAS